MLAVLLVWSLVLLTAQSLADQVTPHIPVLVEAVPPPLPVHNKAVPLLTVLDEDASSIPDCQEEGLESCEKVDVDFDAFLNDLSLLFPGGIALDRNIRVNGTGGSFSYTYEANGTGTTILTYTNNQGYEAIDGSMNLGTDNYYVLENCGPDCHVLGKESKAKTHAVNPYQNETGALPPASRILGPDLDRLLNLGREGGEAVFTVEFYYTPAFARVTSNIEAFFNNEINQVNVGYQQSLIEARAKIHCIKQVDLSEPDNKHQRLTDFYNSITPTSSLFNSADITVLFYATPCSVPGKPDEMFCGQVMNLDSVNTNAPPIGWVAKNCGYTLAHEIGHMFGARHDRDQDYYDWPYPDAHGYLINGGYRTIMAYWNINHRVQLNYYSNTIYTYRRQLMGDSRNNNQRIIQLNRFAIASKGNERKSCTGVEFAGTVSSSCANVESDRYCCDLAFQGLCPHSHANCSRTCRRCCQDAAGGLGTRCPYYASKGYCTHRYVHFMNCNCPRSCGFCPDQ